jgi:hypothetical protein
MRPGRSFTAMTSHRFGSAFAVVFVAAALAACGGGGGGGTVPGGGGVMAPTTPAPTATPVSTAPPSSTSVTLLTASGSTLTAGIRAASADAVVLAQAATTPTEPPSGSSLAQWTATVSDTSGTTASSAARSAQLRQRILESHGAERTDRMREMTFSASALREQLRGVLSHPVRAPQSVRTTQAAPGTVGQQRQFKILTSNIGNSGGCSGGQSTSYTCFQTITTTLEAVGAHGNIWVDNAALATAGEFTNVPAEFAQIAQQFDSYYATETSAFAPAFYANLPAVTFQYSSTKTQCDANGNDLGAGHYTRTDLSGSNGTSIDVVITDVLAGTGEGGYYYGGNELPQSLFDCQPPSSTRPVSNNTSMFVITGNNYPAGPNLPQFNEPYWLNTDVPRSMSHELQHLLHAHYKVFRPAIQGQSAVFDDAFVEEGMSMLAEDLAADGVHIDTPRYSFSFLLEPSLFSLTSFTGYQPNPTSTATNPPYGWFSNTPGSYGQAYLFQRYLYDRFGGGEITSIYNSTGSSVAAVSGAAGEPFPQLYREFAAAVSAQSSPAAGAPYTFSSAIVLRGNVDVPSRRSGSLSTRHLVFGGPQPPEIFANNLPTGFLTLAPGTNGSTFLIDGGTLFLPAANGGSGSTITVSAPGAPSYQGASVQGALPTPPPSST